MPLISTIFQFQLPIDKALHLFDTFRKPRATYNSVDWSVMAANQIGTLRNNHLDIFELSLGQQAEKMHLKSLKIILGVKNTCYNLPLLGEINRLPLAYSAYIMLLTF